MTMSSSGGRGSSSASGEATAGLNGGGRSLDEKTSSSAKTRGSLDGGGPTLTLKSPVGKEAMVYSWPLKKGKGSVKRSEDKQDEAAEIIETIR